MRLKIIMPACVMAASTRSSVAANGRFDTVSTASTLLMSLPPVVGQLARKPFFLKEDAKTPARLSRGSPRQKWKSFLVLFFKKELLA
jgi:hypothetical protein